MRRVLIGLAALGVLVPVALIALFLFLEAYAGPELSVEISVPDVVTAGKPFRVQFWLSNPHDEAVALDSIDVDNSVIENFRVASITIVPTDTIDAFGQTTFYFEHLIGPGQRDAVEFELKAKSAGMFPLAFEVCNEFLDCSRNVLHVQVRDPNHE
jgi:hypothetical protein